MKPVRSKPTLTCNCFLIGSIRVRSLILKRFFSFSGYTLNFPCYPINRSVNISSGGRRVVPFFQLVLIV